VISAEDYHRVAGVRNVRGSRLPAGRALTPGEVVALLDACAYDETAAGARDAAIIALLYGAGLRRSEAAALDLAHYDSTADELKVRGKGTRSGLCRWRTGSLPPSTTGSLYAARAPGGYSVRFGRGAEWNSAG
jgi:integrase